MNIDFDILKLKKYFSTHDVINKNLVCYIHDCNRYGYLYNGFNLHNVILNLYTHNDKYKLCKELMNGKKHILDFSFTIFFGNEKTYSLFEGNRKIKCGIYIDDKNNFKITIDSYIFNFKVKDFKDHYEFSAFIYQLHYSCFEFIFEHMLTKKFKYRKKLKPLGE